MQYCARMCWERGVGGLRWMFRGERNQMNYYWDPFVPSCGSLNKNAPPQAHLFECLDIRE